jgi:hypothetical protein
MTAFVTLPTAGAGAPVSAAEARAGGEASTARPETSTARRAAGKLAKAKASRRPTSRSARMSAPPAAKARSTATTTATTKAGRATETTATSATPALVDTGEVVALSCAGRNPTPVDLVDLVVHRAGPLTTFSVGLSGIDRGQHLWVGITFADKRTRVSGELFEEGSLIGQVEDLVAVDGQRITQAQMSVRGMSLVVADAVVRLDRRSLPLTVELRLDGPIVETCQSKTS